MRNVITASERRITFVHVSSLRYEKVLDICYVIEYLVVKLKSFNITNTSQRPLRHAILRKFYPSLIFAANSTKIHFKPFEAKAHLTVRS
jgi:hypothetical protein